MTERPKAPARPLLTAAAVLLLVILVFGVVLMQDRKAPPPAAPPPPETAAVPVKHQPVIDYGQLAKDKQLGDMMAERKAAYGVQKGLDMVVTADESVRIGGETVRMEDVQRKIQAQEGGILEKDLNAASGGAKNAFGIYVVQPGDNIWNIHFKLLKDYFAHKGVDMTPMADEPAPGGFSSGVGKLLKFSENMVYIYNVKKHVLVTDLNIIQPLSKIVVYKMDRVFDLLEAIDYSKVDLIRFDGENIWIPARQ